MPAALTRNYVQVIGQLVYDVEVQSKTTKEGKPFSWARLTVETDYRTQKGKEYRERHIVFVPGDMSGRVDGLKKGDTVLVVGHLKTDSYKNKEGVEVKSTSISADDVFGFSSGTPAAKPEKKFTAQREEPDFGDDF